MQTVKCVKEPEDYWLCWENGVNVLTRIHPTGKTVNLSVSLETLKVACHVVWKHLNFYNLSDFLNLGIVRCEDIFILKK